MQVGKFKVVTLQALKFFIYLILCLLALSTFIYLPARAQEATSTATTELIPTETSGLTETETGTELPTSIVLPPTDTQTLESTEVEMSTVTPTETSTPSLTPTGFQTETATPSIAPTDLQTATATQVETTVTCQDLGFDAELCEAVEQGRARVIVELAIPTRPLSQLSAAEQKQQEHRIATAQSELIEDLSPTQSESVREFDTIPFIALNVDLAGLVALADSPLVAEIQIDQIHPLLLAQSVPLIRAPQVWDLGYTGAGQTVAILDTGIDKNHPFITAAKVVAEACFSSSGLPNFETVCPNGLDQQIGSGAGEDCQVTNHYTGCSHGTHVAGIVAGENSSFSGVAPDATLISVQVFSKYNVQQTCGAYPCVVAFDSDIVQGLEYVYQQRNNFNIAAVNMSLGGGRYSSYCNGVSAAMKTAIDNLRSAGIATVIAAGNDGRINELAFPACISSAISVGATTDGDAIAAFSNSASFLSVLAPGASITSSVVGGYQTYNGTSMAAPHVAGVIALLKELDSSFSVDQVLTAIRASGKMITDPRVGNRIIPRIQAFEAFQAIAPRSAKPTIIAPFANASVNSSNPTFSWNSVSNAVRYRVQIFFNKALTSQERSVFLDPGQTTYNPEFLADGTYYWRIVGVNQYGFEGAWTDARALTIDTSPPSIPGLTAPLDAHVEQTTTPKFQWTASAGAAQYQLQISDVSDFSNVLLAQSQSGLTYTLNAAEALDFENNFWHVRAQDLAGNWSDWSVTRQFTISLLNLPKTGTFMSDSTPRLQWLTSSGAIEYNVQVDEADPGDFSTPLADQAESGLSTIIPDLNPGAYVWRLRVRNASGWSSWGAAWMFVISPTPPAAPLLSIPANNAILNDSTPNLEWGAVGGGASYQVQVSSSSSFTSLLQDQAGIVAANFDLAFLNDGKYYVRIRAQNDYGWVGAWSASRSFSIDTVAPAIPAYLSPGPGSSTAGTPTFSWTKPSSSTQFQLQLDLAGETFDLPEFDSGVTSSNSLKPATSAFSQVGDFSWRIRARDLAGNWSPWSVPRTLTITLPLPAAPTQISPAAGIAINDPTPSLVGFGVAYGTEFEFQIASNSRFTSTLQNSVPLSANTFEVPNPLLDGTWYWRVRMLNSGGQPGPWSAARVVVIDTLAPGIPLLKLPLENFIARGGAVLHQWSSLSGATQYELQYDEVSGNFDTPVYQSGPFVGLTKSVPPQVLGAYIWRLRAGDAAGNWGVWTTPRSLNTVLPLPSAPTLVTPATAAVLSTEPELAWNVASGADKYEVQISTAKTFASFTAYHLASSVTTFTPSGLTDGTYYWRVRGFNLNTPEESGSFSATRTFVIDRIAPPAPALLLPADGTTSVGIPTFAWSKQGGATQFQFQINDGSEFDSGLISANSIKPGGSFSGLGALTWRVRARDAAGNWSNWSAPRGITITLPIPSAPILGVPSNNTSMQQSDPIFAWTSVPYADHYEIWIDKQSNFAGGHDYEQITLSGQLSEQPILAEGKYYWRVRGYNVNNQAGAWSASFVVTIDLTAPASPLILKPANGFVYRGAPNFQWTPSSGATQYQVQVGAVGDNFTTPVYDTDWIATSSHSAAFSNLGDYEWRLRARDAAGNMSGWTDTRTFSIIQPLPIASGLLSPSANAVTTDNSPTFIWQAVAWGNVYQIQIDNNSNFVSPERNFTGGVSVLTYTPTVLPNGVYYWRVRAWNSNGTPEAGTWSVVRKLTIQ